MNQSLIIFLLVCLYCEAFATNGSCLPSSRSLLKGSFKDSRGGSSENEKLEIDKEIAENKSALELFESRNSHKATESKILAAADEDGEERLINSAQKKQKKGKGMLAAAASAVAAVFVALAAARQTDTNALEHLVFKTADDIPTSYFKDHRVIEAELVKVIDGDTIRVVHIPGKDDVIRTSKGKSNVFLGFGKASTSKQKKPPREKSGGRAKLSENSISVRFIAVDAPETAKFGNAGQPLALEAKQFVEEQLGGVGSKVNVVLLNRDRYKRVLGSVEYGHGQGQEKGGKKRIEEELLKEGLGVVYRQGGAEYGDRGRAFFDRLEVEAQKAQKGVWERVYTEDGVELKMESPAKYKQRVRDKQNKSKSRSKKSRLVATKGL